MENKSNGNFMKRVHFMGIAGSGCSAIAAIASKQGFYVSGCDKQQSGYTDSLEGIKIAQEHSAAHINNIDILAISPAVMSLDPNNAELEEAKRKGIKVVTWQEFMGEYLEKGKFVICICGTHGKSTTTAMAGLMLEDLGLDPSVELGAVVNSWKSNFRVGKGKYFVSEADEYNDNFLVSYPDIAIVTSVEMDHPEYFKNFDEYKASFVKFLSKTRKLIIANLADANVAEVVKLVMKLTSASCVDYSKSKFNLNLLVGGDFNKLNASAVFCLGLLLGLDPGKIRKSLEKFSGIGRRNEYIGEFLGAKIYSDYGHHPSEIKLTSLAFRQKFPKLKLMIVFQPHMFTRTKVLFDDFVSVLSSLSVDRVGVLDIFPSREVDMGFVSSQELVQAVGKKKVEYIQGESQLVLAIKKYKPDAIMLMGAGSIDKMARDIVKL